jgi:hypothetical protein
METSVAHREHGKMTSEDSYIIGTELMVYHDDDDDDDDELRMTILRRKYM